MEPAYGSRSLSPQMERHVGIEIELGGLDERQVAKLAADMLGGRPEDQGDQHYIVKATRLGDIEVYLDTAFRKENAGMLRKLGLDAARLVVPVEIVTEPIPPEQIRLLDELCARARADGATGTRDGLLLGFGVHLNVATTGDKLDDILPTLQTFALLEDLIRKQDPIDPSRRLLPFVGPYPRKLVDDLADQRFSAVSDLISCYLSHNTTRNRALDMLPIFADIDPDLVESHVGGEKLSPRPAYHFRLPDCGIDDPDWSLQREWARWERLERIAGHAACLADLRRSWGEHRSDWTTLRPRWAKTSAEVLDKHGLQGPFL